MSLVEKSAPENRALTPSEGAGLWKPLLIALSRIFFEIGEKRRSAFRVEILLDKVRPNPCLSGFLDNAGHVVVQLGFGAKSGSSVGELQQAWLKVLGWQLSCDKSMTYRKTFLNRDSWNFVALQVVAMLKAVFNIRSDVWFKFPERLEDEMVTASSGFWHHVSSTSVVCLPKQNPQQTLQGLLDM